MQSFLKLIVYPIAVYQILVDMVFRLPLIGAFISRKFDVISSILVSALRLFSGYSVAEGTLKKPDLPLVLYEFEGCPFCRHVRETLAVLDLDVLVHPCPKETLKSSEIKNSRYRGEVLAKGGKAMFPYLVDVNTQTELYDSERIVQYLWSTYGKDAAPPLGYRLVNSSLWRIPNSINNMIIPAFLRPLPRMGMIRTPSRKPEKTLELWGFEESPVTRLVREALCSLEITYINHTVSYGSPNRKVFKDKFGSHLSTWRKAMGKIKVPLLIDPNTGTFLFESGDIIKYLNDTYKIKDGPNETILDFNFSKAAASHDRKPSQYQH